MKEVDFAICARRGQVSYSGLSCSLLHASHKEVCARRRAQLSIFDLCRFYEKISFERYLTWIQFLFKLDIFKKKVRFGFIFKQICFNLIGIYFSINIGCLFIDNKDFPQHKDYGFKEK
jgi:hypothetical protein